MEIKIIIPSHKRAERLSAIKAVSNASVCVPESQEKEYRDANPEAEIITHPDSIVGLAPKRAWIYEKFENVFMMDDDVTGMYRLFHEPKSEQPGRMKPGEAYQVIQMVGNVAKDMGAYLFGFSTVNDLRNYNPFKPFRLKGLCNGCGLGLLKGSKIYFPKESTAVEDYFASLINAYYHRYAFFDDRFGLAQKKTFHNDGGQSEFRNIETEKKDYLFLKKMFGDAVQKRGKSSRGKATHEWQRVIKLPY